MPLKRHTGLQPLSREHHHSLLLCWKIRTGLKNGISPKRIKKYVDWFFAKHILPHFEIEELFVFSLLDADDIYVKKALSQHRKLNRLCRTSVDLEKNLSLIEEVLEQHIRFEERVLFPIIQTKLSDDQLKSIEKAHHDSNFVDNLTDPFWEK